MSLVRPFSSISPKGLLVSGHLKNVNRPFLEAPDELGTHGRVHGNAYTIQMWWTNCSVSDSSLLLVFAPNRPSYTTYREKRLSSDHPTSRGFSPHERETQRTWMLAGKHSAARRDRKRCGRIFNLTLVLTGSCFSSCFTLPA